MCKRCLQTGKKATVDYRRGTSTYRVSNLLGALVATIRGRE